MAHDNLSAPEALARLIEGNKRYSQNVRSIFIPLRYSQVHEATTPPVRTTRVVARGG